jgi:alanine racemase
MLAVLDRTILKSNARAWKQHSGVDLRAVVKSDGYGWGIEKLVAALDDEVDGYCVVDLAEFDALRRATGKPVAILGDIPADEIARVLDAGGIPNVGDASGIAAAGEWARERGTRARVRAGLRGAAAWSGIDERDVEPFAAALAREMLEVECWTHFTDPSLAQAQRAAFERFVETLRGAGVAIAGCDVDATASCAADPATDVNWARIGVGLFGSGAARVAGLACALSVCAPIVRVVPAEGQLVGYGLTRAPLEGFLQVVRCGYGDGFPRIAEPFGSLLTVGMQYTVATSAARSKSAFVDLISPATDLDALAAAARLAPHEVVVRLGHAARVQTAVH